jgi:CRP-like cAMP-binding protein
MPATVTALSAAWLARLDLAGYEQTVQRVLVQRQERTVRLLSHVPMLAGVSARVLARLAAVLVERRVERDQVVVQQGEPSDSVFFVRSGQLRVVRELEPGFFLEINQLGPHMSFGEAGVVLERPRSASVIALEQSVLLVARKLDFFRQLDRSTLQSVIRRADEGLPSDTKLRQLHRKALQWEETKRRVVREACRGRARATHL